MNYMSAPFVYSTSLQIYIPPIILIRSGCIPGLPCGGVGAAEKPVGIPP